MKLRIPTNELRFEFSRSSGPGGQNVNKVNTKATLSWDFMQSATLSEEQKQTLAACPALQRYLARSGCISLSNQTSRSQAENRERAAQRLLSLIEVALRPRRRRKRTAMPRAAKQKRLDAKRVRAMKIKERRAKEHY